MYAFFWLPQFPLAIIATNLAAGLVVGGQLTVLNSTVAWIMLVVDVFLFFGLFMWTDQVLPDTYGISKHPCFCLRKSKRTYVQNAENYANGDAAVKINGLTKRFGKFTAVDNLNLEIR